MAKEALIRVEIDADIKEEAERILAEQGITLEEAIRIFYAEVVRCHGWPPEMMEENGETLKADG